MMIPTVHRDGTPKDELLRQLQEARDALNEAVRLTRLACPHVRDFAPQGEHALGEALRERRERIDKLVDVLDDFDELLAGIRGQPER